MGKQNTDKVDKKETKEEMLIRRVFKEIATHHFGDHKMIGDYCGPVKFSRSVGDAVANFVQGRDPEYYHKIRRQIEKQIESYGEI